MYFAGFKIKLIPAGWVKFWLYLNGMEWRNLHNVLLGTVSLSHIYRTKMLYEQKQKLFIFKVLKLFWSLVDSTIRIIFAEVVYMIIFWRANFRQSKSISKPNVLGTQCFIWQTTFSSSFHANLRALEAHDS